MFEKKRGKRFLASVMALVMLLSLAPVGALAAGETPTNEECSAMPLPANEDNPKPVVTDEENTENTNEEPTPPPRNEGDTGTPADNNDTSTAISEAEIIPEKELIDEAFGVDSKEEIQQYGNKENGNAVVQYSVSGSNTVKVGETITLTCNNKLHWPSHNWYTFGNSVAVEGDTKSNTITVKGLKEGTATVYCSGDSKQINVTDPQYVIRFYVSGTGTEGRYDEQHKYSVAGQPNSTFEDAVGDNPLALSVSAGYAILTDYNDTAKNITTDEFTSVNVNGDAAVREWLTTYANRGVQDGLTNRNNVETIVANVNKQYTDANNNYYKDKGITLPLLKTEYYNGFRFVNAYYVPSGESTIHVNVQLVKNTEYIVRYEPNGGAGDAYEDSTLYLNGQQASVKSNTFTNVGYTFNGWNTKPDGSGTSYQSGDKITIEKANVTLYAQWKAKEYKVKYNLNYEGAPDTLEDKTEVKWEDNNLLPGDNPSREDFLFDAWYTQPTGGDKVDSNTAYSEVAANDTDPSVTLYAHWTEDPTARPTITDVYVYFKMVDAAGKNIPTNKINNEDLKKTVYNAEAGGATWATLGKIASAATLENGEKYTGTNATLKTVGNEATAQLKGDALHDSNKEIVNKVLANIEWFQLKQWDGATDYVPNGSSWHLDGKITGYTVTYNNGTTDDVHNMPVADKMYYLSGSNYTVSNATPTRTGYVFTGWKSNIENDTTIYNAKGKFEMPAKNVVLTAQWEKDELVDPSVDKPAGITKGDGIADKYQIQVNFKAVNGTFKDGKNSITEYTTVVTKYTSGEPSENGTAKLANEHLKAENPDPGFTGPGSWKKGTDACEKPEADDSVQNGDHFVVTFEQEKESVANPIHYTINQHFIDAQKADKIKSTPEQATEVKTFGDSIPEEMLAVKQDFGDPKQNYVYVPAETTYKVGDQKKETTDNLANGAVIDLYYYLDVIGGKDEKGNLIDKGDEIPDCYQVTIIYKSSDERRGKISDASLKKEVLTIKDEEGNRLSSGKVEITGASAEVTDSRCYFVNWTKKQEGTTDVSTVTSSANLTAQTFNAKGGDVYTFTANFDRSSGGGSGGSNRPKPPVVDIPDDVPTGLNGKDHYAYIIGYGNNDVRPQNNITRAEVATIFFRLLTDETREANMTKSNGYNDVKDGDWFCCAVSTLSKMGIIKGYEDGSFKPNDPISRAEFAAIAARFDPDGDKTPASFFDVSSHWAKDEISIAANHGWIKGYEDGSFKPDQKITRAETMTLVNRVLNRLPETKDDLHKDMKTWVDNMDETAWYYLAVQEATNSHYFKNKTSTKFEQWTDLRDTRDWSELEK